MVLTMNESEQKAGYKLTEVGLIPEEWEVILLDSIARRGSGHTPDKKHPEYWHGDIKWVSLKDTDRLDKVYITDTIEQITDKGLMNSSAVLHLPGAVILLRDASVGKSAIIGEAMAVSQHFIAWSCSSRLVNFFLYYWLQKAKSEFERIAIGNTIKTIGLPYFKRLQIPLPPLPEQTAIATALSDVDALITSLDKLIAKKRDIKQATMQQLLTGKRRLRDGSSNDVDTIPSAWRIYEFDQVVSIRRSKVNPKINQDCSFCIELENIGQASGQLKSYTDITNVNSIKAQFELGDVLFGRLRAYLKKFWLADRKGLCSTEIWPLMPNKSVLIGEYLFQLVQMSQFIEAASSAYGTHMPRTDWNFIKHYKVCLPPLPEQTAIAQILSDMDAEIEVLERKRDKIQVVKQGMMQELLTGKKRLL